MIPDFSNYQNQDLPDYSIHRTFLIQSVSHPVRLLILKVVKVVILKIPLSDSRILAYNPRNVHEDEKVRQ